MGSFHFKPFSRNDAIEGQGKEVLLFAKAMRINNYELDRMYHEFRRLEDPETHLVEISSIFAQCKKIKYRLFDQLVYQLFDDHKSGKLNFVDYVTIQWGFLTTDETMMAILCFSMFDFEKTQCLDITEVRYLINVLWDFNPSRSTMYALQKLDANVDCAVSLQEFVLLCKYHPEILEPLRRTKAEIRKAIVFTRFWTDMLRKRIKSFGNQTIFDLRPNHLGLNYPALNMDYLNLRSDVVPAQFIEQYKLTQKKKRTSYQGIIEMPYELREEMHKIEEAQEEKQEHLENMRVTSRLITIKLQPKMGVYLDENY